MLRWFYLKYMTRKGYKFGPITHQHNRFSVNIVCLFYVPNMNYNWGYFFIILHGGLIVSLTISCIVQRYLLVKARLKIIIHFCKCNKKRPRLWTKRPELTVGKITQYPLIWANSLYGKSFQMCIINKCHFMFEVLWWLQSHSNCLGCRLAPVLFMGFRGVYWLIIWSLHRLHKSVFIQEFKYFNATELALLSQS